jgi:hypothetical protein
MKHYTAVPQPTPAPPGLDTSLHPDGMFFSVLLVLVSIYQCGRSKVRARRTVKLAPRPSKVGNAARAQLARLLKPPIGTT